MRPMTLILDVPQVRVHRPHRDEWLLLHLDWRVLIDFSSVFHAIQAHFRHPLTIVKLPLVKALRFHHRARDRLARFGRSDLPERWLLHLLVSHAHQQRWLLLLVLLLLLVHDLKLAIIWLKL